MGTSTIHRERCRLLVHCWSGNSCSYFLGSRWKPYDVVAKVAEALAPTLGVKEVPEAAAEAAVAAESGWPKRCSFNPKPSMTPNLDLDNPHQAEAEQDEGKGLETPGPQAHDTHGTHVQQIPVACLL